MISSVNYNSKNQQLAFGTKLSVCTDGFLDNCAKGIIGEKTIADLKKAEICLNDLGGKDKLEISFYEPQGKSVGDNVKARIKYYKLDRENADSDVVHEQELNSGVNTNAIADFCTGFVKRIRAGIEYIEGCKKQ